MNDAGLWAPRAPGLTLHDAQGTVITGASAQALARVRQVRIDQPAALAACEGNGSLLAAGPEVPGERRAVPIVTSGPDLLAVDAVHRPRSRLGEWVELQVNPPAQRRALSAP